MRRRAALARFKDALHALSDRPNPGTVARYLEASRELEAFRAVERAPVPEPPRRRRARPARSPALRDLRLDPEVAGH
jgi:hypothetical protein